MEPTDLTFTILKALRSDVKAMRGQMREMRGQIQEMRGELRQTHVRIDETSERVEAGFADVSRRLVESEIRTSTAITDLVGTVRGMTSVLRAKRDLRPRVERCERDIAALQRKLGKD